MHKIAQNCTNAQKCYISKGEDGDTNTCPRCHGMVFEAEKQIAKSGSYHKKCFTCSKCKHQMDATNFTNGPDNDVYCFYCYRVRMFLDCFINMPYLMFFLNSRSLMDTKPLQSLCLLIPLRSWGNQMTRPSVPGKIVVQNYAICA